MARKRKNSYVVKELRRRKIERRYRAITRFVTIVEGVTIVVVFEFSMIALALM